MKWTDKDIDKLYSENSERLAFDYKKVYWDEFDAQLSEVQDAGGSKGSLSDAAIDSIYAASSAGLAFDYKKDYWNEFNESLPKDTTSDVPKTALSDIEIDAMYSASAAELSFDYSNSYWNEFNASLPQGAPLDSIKPVLTDAEIDAMYAASAARLSFDYSGDYWKDFNASFPSGGVLTDSGIDGLYQESAGGLSFDYKSSYWEEFKGRIRRQRRPDLLWFLTAYSFVGVLGVMALINANSITGSKRLTADSNKIETQKNNISNSQSKIGNSSTSDAATDLGTISPVNSVKNGNSNLSLPGNLSPSRGELAEPVVFTNVPTIQPSDLNQDLPATPEVSDVTQTPVIIADVPTDQNTSVPAVTPENRNLVESTTNLAPKGNEQNNPKGENSARDQSADKFVISETQEEVRLPYGSQDPLDLSAPSLAPLPSYPISFKRGAFVVGYVQGIGGLSQSLVIPSDQSSNSFGIGIGTEVHKGNFTFNLGMNAIVENHNDLVLNRTAKVYGFGSDVYQFKIDYKQLYTLEAMIGVGYNLGRHRIDLGVRPSLIMSSRVHIEEIGSSTTEFASDSDYNESRDVFGFMDGLHRFGIKPTIGYMFKVSPSISLGGNIGVELRSSINEGFINGVNNILPIDGQIYIRKTLSFRRK